MAKKQITHIRHQPWPGTPATNEALCGADGESSISYEHALRSLDSKIINAHLASLELCDDCWEGFKKDQPAYFYEEMDA